MHLVHSPHRPLKSCLALPYMHIIHYLRVLVNTYSKNIS
nr:MAG TPA: hypothetical protein [Caudoviricetes sp.]